MKKKGYLGCDVSKGMCNFVLEDGAGKVLEPNFALDDNRAGHQSLYALLKQAKATHRLGTIVVGVESTGGYENNWYRGLRSQSQSLGLEVFRINPKRIYHEVKVEGRRSISDGISAKVISGYLRKNYGRHDLETKRLAQTDQDNRSLRNLYKYIQSLTKQNTRTKNALEKNLYQTMPGILSIKPEKYAGWFLEMLIKYPSEEAILAAGIEGLTSIKYINHAKAQGILAAIQNSAGGPANRYDSLVIEQRATDIKALSAKIKMLKDELHSLAREKMQQPLEIVNSIKGIADDTAVPILLELGQLARFDKGKNLVAFWGINPTIKQSGDKKVYIGMSKDGSPLARATVYLAASNVVRHEPYFTALYHKMRSKGKGHKVALGVVMAKLTRIIYGMLKSGKPFDAGIDLLNQSKIEHRHSAHKTTSNPITKQMRRHQASTDHAPISRRQKKLRRQEQSVPS